jgi:hypothetical protein
MIIQSQRTSAPGRAARAGELLDDAKGMTRSTIDRIARRTPSATKTEAMQSLARSAGVAPGTLETLLRDRLKNISAADYAAIRAVCIEEIQREIDSLERELRRARTAGAGDRPRPADLREAEAALQMARRLISMA